MGNSDTESRDASLDGSAGQTDSFDYGETEGLLAESSALLTNMDGDDKSSLPPPPSKSQQQQQSEVVRWRDLPHKGQLTVLTLARLSEPLVQTSLQSYMFYQLRSFDPSLPDSTIASQAGILNASFTATQFLTAMLWGQLADSPRFGRKHVLMIGLSGTMLSCLGFGFSQSFWQALFFRSLGGATNGNIGVLRTIYQSRAFLLLPMTYNIGVIIGPILGGLLCDPANSYPTLFGDNAFFLRFPYATPNLLSAFLLFAATLAVWMGLGETLDSLRGKPDYGFALRRKIVSLFRRAPTGDISYVQLATEDDAGESAALLPAASTANRPRRARYTQRLSFRRMLTKNVTLTLLAQCIFGFHLGAFNSLWFIFLSTPVYDPAKRPGPVGGRFYLQPRAPFFFSGGIGLPPAQVGLAMAILGSFGILMQLFLYPTVSGRLGTLRSWRLFLCLFPLTYFLVPYLSLVPGASPSPHAKDGPTIWLAIAAVLLLHVVARTFALPAQTILINNCTPHPSVLGTLHGLAQSTSSLTKTLGPVLCGYLYGFGLNHGIVGAVFWGLSLVAVWGFTASLAVYEGNGHEIWLEGDAEEM
ncbi:major facilitator superfamily transporter [Grosmannia clavigera kw1407]|uniref:Major facilitator superfamily transporter n=1 Tax=Grosmannia clavigera (strain kw1407 / UAMH 11150) TaxID=655863 RepID=F0XHR3_GROCL|nr:major facilitator superfamily transporter [Grosmannia clavigera kw1407]EFX03310.1 major facilitator superfamily transporter [Grosmannia clavigera kw1407]